MKEELRKQWTAALRSGAYRQTWGYLCDQGRYCCLGVLADIYNKDQPIEEHQPMGDTVLCSHVREQMGLRSEQGAISHMHPDLEEIDVTLATLNDGMWVDGDHAKKLREMSKTLANVKDKSDSMYGDHSSLGTKGSGRGEYWQMDFNQIADLIDEIGDQL